MATKRERAVDAALAGAAQLAAGELTASLLAGARSPVSGLGRLLIDATPGPGVDVVVATAATADKPLLRTLVSSAWVAGPALAGRRWAPRWMAALAAGTGAVAATRREADAAASALAAGAGLAAGMVALAALGGRPGGGRRGAVAATAAGALAAAAARPTRGRAAAEAARSAVTLPPWAARAPGPARGGSFDIPGLSALFTAPEDFYVTDVQFPAPEVLPSAWRLRVTGMVDRELALSLDDLLGMELVELDATLVCVHNPPGGSRVGSARWLGVPVGALLERAGVHADARQLVARSVDGFTAGVPVDHVTGGQPALVALAMNGEPLPVDNGFPARLLVPGLWGADANTKWLAELELTTWGAVRDYWDRRGWPRQPSAVRPGSRIDVPANRARLPAGPVTVAGVAWAPPAGVEAVEVSVDGGPWQPAELSTEVAPTLWRQWRAPWEAASGDHELRVRARGRRRTQTGRLEPPYPVGASGYHAVRVHVSEDRAGSRGAPPARAAAAADDARGRLALAAAGVAAWRARGFPPPPRWPAPGS